MEYYIYIGGLLLLPAVLAFVIATTGILSLNRPKYLVLIYLMVLYYFPNPTWGLLDPTSVHNIYSRGSGYFFFPIINLYLFGLAIIVVVSRACNILPQVKTNLRPYLWAFVALFVGHMAVGITMDVEWYLILSSRGIFHLIDLILFFYVLVHTFQKREDLDQLTRIFLFCAATRGLWGIARFLFLGGDPANSYANYQHIDVKLVFFDINDGFVATVAAFFAGWKLTREWDRLAEKERFLYSAIALIELFVVVFSYRRTGQGGLLLAFALLIILMPKRLRMRLAPMALAVMLVGIVAVALQRASNMLGGSIWERLFPDITHGGGVSFTTGRFAEAYAAFLTVKDHMLLGVGAWGEYKGGGFKETEFHHGVYDYMHSGILHIWLKSGLLGLAIFLGMWLAFFRFVARQRGRQEPTLLGFYFAGAAGVLYFLPTWFVGTPVVEFRTMQLFAFALAMPYMVHAASQRALVSGK